MGSVRCSPKCADDGGSSTRFRGETWRNTRSTNRLDRGCAARRGCRPVTEKCAVNWQNWAEVILPPCGATWTLGRCCNTLGLRRTLSLGWFRSGPATWPAMLRPAWRTRAVLALVVLRGGGSARAARTRGRSATKAGSAFRWPAAGRARLRRPATLSVVSERASPHESHCCSHGPTMRPHWLPAGGLRVHDAMPYRSRGWPCPYDSTGGRAAHGVLAVPSDPQALPFTWSPEQ